MCSHMCECAHHACSHTVHAHGYLTWTHRWLYVHMWIYGCVLFRWVDANDCVHTCTCACLCGCRMLPPHLLCYWGLMLCGRPYYGPAGPHKTTSGAKDLGPSQGWPLEREKWGRESLHWTRHRESLWTLQRLQQTPPHLHICTEACTPQLPGPSAAVPGAHRHPSPITAKLNCFPGKIFRIPLRKAGGISVRQRMFTNMVGSSTQLCA